MRKDSEVIGLRIAVNQITDHQDIVVCESCKCLLREFHAHKEEKEVKSRTFNNGVYAFVIYETDPRFKEYPGIPIMTGLEDVYYCQRCKKL